MSSNVYTAVATTTGRDGRAASDDGRLDVKLSLPAELGGDGGDGTNPEQLFAAGYAACFATSMKLVAPRRGLDASDVAVTATVGLAPNGSGGFALNVALRVAMPPHITPDAARGLVDATHQVCPYSNATRGNIPVELIID